jgi:predicted HicB family RNase H-like nuclease
MMTYKGYTAVDEVDHEAGVIRGHVIDLKDTITFQGRTVPEAVQAFHDSVDDYLEFRASLGESPEKPFSGKLLVRVKPKVHRGLTIAARSEGVSLNTLVTRELERIARRTTAAVHVSPPEGPVGNRVARAARIGRESAKAKLSKKK